MPEEPSPNGDTTGALAKSLEERDLTLPAHRVIGALIHAFGVDPPRLASDPLGFLADQLRVALDLTFSEAEPALYNLERVLQRVERGKALEAERWTTTEKGLQAFWDAVQRGDDEGLVIAAESLATLDLDVTERARVVDQLDAVCVALPVERSELGLHACEIFLALASQAEPASENSAWAARQARALVGRGYRLGHLERDEEALASYADVLQRFANDPAPALRKQVAWALFNQGLTLSKLRRVDEALVSFAEVLERFGGDRDPALREPVARALLSQGLALGKTDRHDEELTSYAEVIERFGDDATPALQDASLPRWSVGVSCSASLAVPRKHSRASPSCRAIQQRAGSGAAKTSRLGALWPGSRPCPAQTRRRRARQLR